MSQTITESDIEAAGDEVDNNCFAMNTHTIVTLCDALLPKLMSGEIRIMDAEGFGKEISIC